MTEQFANNAVTTLDTTIDDDDVTVIVDDESLFPTEPQFRIRIEDELMLVTAVAGATWTVERGIEDTIAVAHTSGNDIVHVLTAEALAQFRADSVQDEDIADLPAAGLVGRLFIPTESPTILRDNGSTWDSFGPLYRLKPPVLSDFTAVNATGSTTTQEGNTILMVVNATNSGNNLHIQKMAAPAAPYTVIMAIKTGPFFLDSNNGVGICLRKNSDGKLVTHYVNARISRAWELDTWSDETNFNSQPTTQILGFTMDVMWLKVEDDNTNRKYFISQDGLYWVQLYSEARTTYITADEIGFFMNYRDNGGLKGAMRVLSWEVLS